MSQRAALMPPTATHATDAVLGTVSTAASTKRSRIFIPDRNRPSTEDEIRAIFLYNQSSQPKNTAEPFDILDPSEEDVFGHGGGLD